jgi:NADPH:quinone reductase-like Zn-dependent oxidoreductase
MRFLAGGGKSYVMELGCLRKGLVCILVVSYPVISILGTLTRDSGSVSLFAVQFAKAAGARVIATTSSPSKIPLLQSLGADHVINYRETPNWGAYAKELTGGTGVDLVVEVAGPTTLRQSAESVKLDGQISVVGFIGGQGNGDGSAQTSVPSLLETWLNLYTVRGVWVGSREQMEEMCRAVEASGIRPVIDERVFKLEELKEAYGYLAEGRNVGKIGMEI